ncbi:hypothetical protein Hanom_Chr06g00537031 [Helianthus anomalus]
MKDMTKLMLENSKCQLSTQQISQELRSSVQPILAAQRELAELNHNKHMELIRIIVKARYKDTHADIRGIKESMLKLISSYPTPIFEKDDDDDAKKGEKDSMRKLEPSPKVKPKGQQKQKPRSAKQTSAKTSDVGKKKGIDETLNIQIDEKILEKQKKHDIEESKAYNWKKEHEEKMKRENIGTSQRRKSFRNNRPPIVTFPKTSATPKNPISYHTPKPNLPLKNHHKKSRKQLQNHHHPLIQQMLMHKSISRC